jgi:putative transposase
VGTHARVRLHFIAPGKPVQNTHIESFHGRFRDECLNESWFVTVADARRIIEAWRQDYNTVRPHSALGYLTPEEFEQLSPNGECGTQEAKQKDGRCLSTATRVSLGAPESP